ESCLACLLPRLPRYKTDKSWSKHQEFCKGPSKQAPQAAAAPGKKPSSSRLAAPISAGVDNNNNNSNNGSSNSNNNNGNNSSREVASLSDLGRLLEVLGRQLEGIEFVRVQLGVTLGERGLSRETAVKLASGRDASDSEVQQLAKEAVLDHLRLEFATRYPGTELVSQEPDLKLLLDVSLWQFAPPIPTAIFLYGRYRKLVRGIPQTRWPCAVCRGERTGRYGKRKLGSEPGSGLISEPGASSASGKAGGTSSLSMCEVCKGSGLQYANSVQDLIGSSLVTAFAAEDGVFHGMGREDIDVRCLGSGRPFVLELRAPRLRRPLQDLQALGAAVNSPEAVGAGRVELSGALLRLSSRAEPARLKGAAADKTYTIRFRVQGGFGGPEDEARILALAGSVLDQRTPSRVEHRRADLVRGRTILALGPIIAEGDEVELTIKAESGTYIKEFVHGDAGRTVPSVSGTLGRKCDVMWLDVREIHGE
ncbi:unnamed protein product, partial [Polarella glacialis]